MGNKGSTTAPLPQSTPPATASLAAPTPAPTPASTPAPSNASSTTLASTTTVATAGGSTATLVPKTQPTKAPGAPAGQGAAKDWDAAYGALASRFGFGATAPTLPHTTLKDREARGGAGRT
ncbi:hypothetical protein PsYK624_087490 [Phanerochaete sordida]|uniref:Uncharacterized protein n=1 Tax=Phanerochaete sordida TaxID=48140 RepID=A0A9P3GDZ1_9APHY|nr:hypothetical protein PsYK624_087490 [Phanerochaete sordida]